MFALAIVSQKGGVGKTTLSLHLAYALAARGHRVLLADCDPQGGIGYSLRQSKASRAGLAEWMAGGPGAPSPVVPTRMERLRLVPVGNVAAADTAGFGDWLADGSRLRALMDAFCLPDEIVLFDTPAGFGGATMGALRVADAVLVPLQAEPIALRTAPQVLEVLGDLRGQGHAPIFAGFVLTMVQMGDAASVSVAEAAYRELPGGTVLRAMVVRDPALLEASAAGVPVALLSARPPAAAAYFDQLAAELEARLNPPTTEPADVPAPLVP
jgi:chromosome partitioning protein